MSDRTSFIKDARELKNSLDSLNFSIFDGSSFTEEDIHEVSKQIQIAYEKCYWIARVPRADVLHIHRMLRFHMCDSLDINSLRKTKIDLLYFLCNFIDYVTTLEEFDEILYDAFAGFNTSSFWYNADEEFYFHIFKSYDDSICMMKIQNGKIEETNPDEFMKYYRAASIYSISNTLVYCRYNLHGITFKK